MNYLGLSDGQEIPEGYGKYIWAGERCLEGIAWSSKNHVEFQVLPKNWETDAQIRQAAEYLQEVKEAVLDYAAGLLNDYHHTDYGKREWNIMLSQWLNIYLASLYDKYLKLLAADSMAEDCACDLYEVSGKMIPMDYMDYFDLLSLSDGFHIYQYSQLYHAMPALAYIHKRIEGRFERPPVVFRPKTAGYWKTAVYRNVIRIWKMVTKAKDQVVLQESYLPHRFLLDVMRRKPGKITNYIIDYYRFERTKFAAQVDENWRRQVYRLPETEDHFIKIACRLLKQNIPLAYAEGFGFIKKMEKKLYRFAMEAKAVVYAAGGSYSDEVFKAYLMDIRKAGARLCCIQHGGNYGIDALWGMKSEYEICDVFYTWGWEKGDNNCCRYQPMPAAKLMHAALSRVRQGEHILYVGYSYGKNVMRIDKRELNYDRDIQGEKEFFKGLSEGLREKMIVRLYTDDYGWRVKESLEAEVPDLKYDEISDFYSSMDQAGLVVLADWSTTVLEALCADKPVLVRRDMDGAEAAALDDLKELERAGVLAQTFEELGQQLERICMDVKTWWREPKRQKTVQKIRNKYAYMPADAKKIWTDEILGLADLR